VITSLRFSSDIFVVNVSAQGGASASRSRRFNQAYSRLRFSPVALL
jgi:hypothetical protein